MRGSIAAPEHLLGQHLTGTQVNVRGLVMPQKLATFESLKGLVLSLLAICALALVYSHRDDRLGPPQDEETGNVVEQTGNGIIAALKAHRAKYGTYPGSLAELVSSGTLTSLPQTDWGTGKWEFYPRGQPDHFLLRVLAKETSYECYYYDTQSGWAADF